MRADVLESAFALEGNVSNSHVGVATCSESSVAKLINEEENDGFKNRLREAVSSYLKKVSVIANLVEEVLFDEAYCICLTINHLEKKGQTILYKDALHISEYLNTMLMLKNGALGYSYALIFY